MNDANGGNGRVALALIREHINDCTEQRRRLDTRLTEVRDSVSGVHRRLDDIQRAMPAAERWFMRGFIALLIALVAYLVTEGVPFQRKSVVDLNSPHQAAPFYGQNQGGR